MTETLTRTMKTMPLRILHQERGYSLDARRCSEVTLGTAAVEIGRRVVSKLRLKYLDLPSQVARARMSRPWRAIG
jgi:hypothetical protein